MLALVLGSGLAGCLDANRECGQPSDSKQLVPQVSDKEQHVLAIHFACGRGVTTLVLDDYRFSAAFPRTPPLEVPVSSTAVDANGTTTMWIVNESGGRWNVTAHAPLGDEKFYETKWAGWRATDAGKGSRVLEVTWHDPSNDDSPDLLPDGLYGFKVLPRAAPYEGSWFVVEYGAEG